MKLAGDRTLLESRNLFASYVKLPKDVLGANQTSLTPAPASAAGTVE